MKRPPVGFVVAGGRSRRMGRDKALLPWGDATLLDDTIARLRACCDEVHILCGAELRYGERGLPVEVDVLAGRGPLGGVLTGLRRIGNGYGLFLAIDLPFVPVALLEYLRDLGAAHPAVVPFVGGRAEPLCASYSTQCVDAVARHVEDGDLKMSSFWREIELHAVEEPELRRFGDPRALFRNLNTPADYEELRPRAGT